MAQPYLLFQRPYLLRPFLPSVGLHVLPPVLVLALRECSLDSLLEGVLVDVVEVEFGGFGADDLVEDGALLKLLLLALAAELWHGYIVAMHVGVGYFRNKLIILLHQLPHLHPYRWKVFQLKPLLLPLLPRRLTIPIILIGLFYFVHFRHLLKVRYGQVEIFNKETREVVSL